MLPPFSLSTRKAFFISFSNLSFSCQFTPPLSTEHMGQRRYKRDATHPKSQCGVTPLGTHQLPSLQPPVPASRISHQLRIRISHQLQNGERRSQDKKWVQHSSRESPKAVPMQGNVEGGRGSHEGFESSPVLCLTRSDTVFEVVLSPLPATGALLPRGISRVCPHCNHLGW